jgi:hypothetical protein
MQLMRTTIDWFVLGVVVVVLVLGVPGVPSLTPVLTDNLSRFYSKAIR